MRRLHLENGVLLILLVSDDGLLFFIDYSIYLIVPGYTPVDDQSSGLIDQLYNYYCI